MGQHEQLGGTSLVRASAQQRLTVETGHQDKDKDKSHTALAGSCARWKLRSLEGKMTWGPRLCSALLRIQDSMTSRLIKIPASQEDHSGTELDGDTNAPGMKKNARSFKTVSSMNSRWGAHLTAPATTGSIGT